MIEPSDIKPLQRQCLLAIHSDPRHHLARAIGGFATSDRSATYTTRTVNGLESLGLVRVTADMLTARVTLTAPGLRLAEQLHDAAMAKAGAA